MSQESQLQGASGERLLEWLRGVCAALPEVEEIVDGFGHTTFKVRKKSFVIAGMGESGPVVSIKCEPATQAFLTRRGPPFFRTPYIGQHGWVSAANPLHDHRDEVAELIVDAYRLAAPRRLVRELE